MSRIERILRSAVQAAGQSGGACILAVALGCTPVEPKPPDIVLVMLDTLRPDHLELHGYEKQTAPFLAAMGERSAVFINALSTSSCTAPAVASLFTGLYPTQHGVYEVLYAHRRLRLNAVATGRRPPDVHLNVLPRETLTLSERLRDLGYEAFGFSTNPNIDAPMGFDRGFDHFSYESGLDAAELVERVASHDEFINAAGPRFLYVHFMDPHAPYSRRDPWMRSDSERGPARKLARYDSEIGFLDHHLAKLFERLDLADDTLVVITSDHGEAFGERGRHGHGFGLNAELNDVLLMIHAPALGIAPAVIDANVSLIDVLPTVLDAVGALADPASDGSSLLPLARGDASAEVLGEFERRALYAHRRQRLTIGTQEGWAVIQGKWKLLDERPLAAEEAGAPSLYDRLVDPREVDDLYDQHAGIARSLQASLDGFKRRGIRESELQQIELATEQIRELEALGYVSDGQAAAP